VLFILGPEVAEPTAVFGERVDFAPLPVGDVRSRMTMIEAVLGLATQGALAEAFLVWRFRPEPANEWTGCCDSTSRPPDDQLGWAWNIG
jgi:hypothetical protein